MPSDAVARALIAASPGPVVDNDPLRNAVRPMADYMTAQQQKGFGQRLADVFGPRRDAQGNPMPAGVGDMIGAIAMGLPMGKIIPGMAAPMSALEQGLEMAALRRGRGLPTGKSAPGWDYKPPPPPEKGSYEQLRQLTNARMENSNALAIEDYLRSVYPQRYDMPQPLRRDIIERGRSGRPTKTNTIPIGTEEKILADGAANVELNESMKMYDRNLAAIQDKLKGFESRPRVELVNGEQKVLASKNISGGAPYRVTYFDKMGPISHTEISNLDDLANELVHSMNGGYKVK